MKHLFSKRDHLETGGFSIFDQEYIGMQLRIFIFILITMGIGTNNSQAQSLSTLKWQKRIIILMDAAGDIQVRNAQLTAFKSVESELQERDLLIFCYNGRQLLNQDLTPSSYKLSGVDDVGFQGVILLGKDGGVKLKEPFPVAPKLIFSLVDGMPMRRAEIKRSGKH